MSQRHPGYVVTGSTVVHDMPRNEKPDLATDSADDMWRYRCLYRNDMHFYRRLGPRGWAYLAAKAAHAMGGVVLRAGDGGAERLGILWSGLLEGLGFNPEPVRLAPARRKRELFF